MKSFKTIVLSLLLIVCNTNLNAQSFEDLSTFNIKSDFPITIKYNKENSLILNERVDNLGLQILRPIKTKLSKDGSEEYIVEYNGGVSADPHFRIYHVVNGVENRILRVNGLDLIIPGDGTLYVSGHTNNMFNKRRRFVLNDGILEEIDQLYYYVGLNTETTQEVELFPDLDYKESNIKLKKGEKIEVLVNTNDDYLIRTKFGLTGWIRIPNGTEIRRTSIKGIYYHGD